MKIRDLTRYGYRWECTPTGWKVFFMNQVIGEGKESQGTCKHTKARTHRKILNREAARQFAKVDFVKRRVAG